MEIREMAVRGRVAARRLLSATRAQKDAALRQVSVELRRQAQAIRAANQSDLEAGQLAGLTEAMLDRLYMDEQRVHSTADGVDNIVMLPDPVGSRGAMERLQNGLLVGRERLPLGLIAIIYESRPNVTVDAAALCLKAGNAVLLRGGKEAKVTNGVLGNIVRRALENAGLPADAVQIVPPGDRETMRRMLSLSGLVDLVIPRGGEGLIRFVDEHARVPVLKHYKGVCHLYLDAGCDAEQAEALTLNGKVQRPGVCNALECLLVHQQVAEVLLPGLGQRLEEHGVELRACPRALRLLPSATPASDEDWGREFLDKILAVKVVDSLQEALDHVAAYGSQHTEAICTANYGHAERWLREVDASCVLVNASTRFNDGGQLGLGAEIGISTTKLHAYGPMGLESLTAEKWVVLGSGQIRQ